MSFHVASKLEYSVGEPTSFLFSIKCIETGGQKILSESLLVDPYVEVGEFSVSGGMNRFSSLRT